MEIIVCNSVGNEEYKYGKCIWIPYLSDRNFLIEHLLQNCKNTEFKIEDVFGFHSESNSNNGKKIFTFTVKEPLSSKSKQNIKIFIYAQSDTLSNSAYIIGSAFKNKTVKYIVPVNDKEKAGTFFENKQQTYSVYSYKELKKNSPDVFVLLNDWAKEARRIIAHCRLLKIPVICVQESIISFGDKFKRMERADYVFVQGSRTVLDLNRQQYFITGNPRYEALKRSPIPAIKKAFINCNFTYGVHEDAREMWLSTIISVLEKNGYDYLISQHPRDTGNLINYKNVQKSSSQEVHSQIEQSSVVITRFSSIVHEALIMGRPVIYFNPHGEKLGYNFEFNNKFLFLASDKNELENALTSINNNNAINTPEWSSYIVRHCMSVTKAPSEIIDELLTRCEFKSPGISFSDIIALVFFHPFVRRIVSLFK